MEACSNNIISEGKTLLQALQQLNSLQRGESLTLLVTNSANAVVGALTDGDIRRALVKGISLNDKVEKVANQKFSFLKKKGFDVNHIHECKARFIELLPVLNDQMQIVDVVNLKKQKSYLPIDAVLMAGGKGERLRPLTDKTPKPLLEMNGKPIIDYCVDHILSYGIRNISVTVNYLKEQLEEHFAEPVNGVQVKTVREPKFLGTIGSLHYVKDLHNDTVLLMNSDAITDIDLEDYYLHFKQHEADMSVAAIPYTISVPYGIFELEGRDIKGVLEKPTYNYYTNAGIYLIKRELLDLIPEGEFFNATDFMEMLMARGNKVIRFPLNDTWIDIGNPQEYAKAKELVKHMKW